MKEQSLVQAGQDIFRNDWCVFVQLVNWISASVVALAVFFVSTQPQLLLAGSATHLFPLFSVTIFCEATFN